MSVAVPQKPVFRSHLRAEVVDTGLVILSEGGAQVITAPASVDVAPLLDGTRTYGDLIAELDGRVQPHEIYFLLMQWTRSGLLRGATAAVVAPNEQAFWDASSVPVPSAARVAIRSMGGVDVAPLARALAEAGLSEAAADQASLTVVAAGDYRDPALQAVNASMLAAGLPWLLVKPVGQTLWIGPLFRPGASACWRCLADRLRLNRQVDDFVMRHKGMDGPPRVSRAALPATVDLAAGLVAMEIGRWLGGDASIENEIRTFDTLRLESEKHRVVRRPQCPACGDPARFAQPRPPRIDPSPKRFFGDGGHRSLTPEQACERLEQHVSRITGVISYVSRSRGTTPGLTYAYTAGHNFAMGLDNLYWLRNSLRSRTGGKGMSDSQARASAMGEAIERYSGVYRGDEPRVRASYRELGDRALHLRDLLHFSDTQYGSRREWNRASTGSFFHHVPNPFDEEAVIDWSPVWTVDGECHYAPASFCYYGHPDSARHFFCSGDTNGASAGLTAAEAVVQGFLELVERDAVAIWWYNRIPRPAVDVDDFGVPALEELRRYYASLGRTFWTLDLTTDLGVPAFATVSSRQGAPLEEIIFGFGAHLDPRVAVLRSVAELNQFLPAVLERDGSGATIYHWPDDDAIRWWRSETVARQAHLAPDPAQPPRRRADFQALAAADLRDDVFTCDRISRDAGLRMFVLDQTRPDIDVPVWRVIVPGLRHFWRRLGPGRLYDVPVRLGWRAEPLGERDLNPLSVFI